IGVAQRPLLHRVRQRGVGPRGRSLPVGVDGRARGEVSLERRTAEESTASTNGSDLPQLPGQRFTNRITLSSSGLHECSGNRLEIGQSSLKILTVELAEDGASGSIECGSQGICGGLRASELLAGGPKSGESLTVN